MSGWAIPSRLPGTYVALPDNGFGAQGNSADFVIGFYHVTPRFKREKRLLVDLLDVDDPRDIGGPLAEIPARKFSFPLRFGESVTAVDPFTR